MSYREDIPENGYAIDDELKMRTMLEESTSWRWEFQKETTYGYDLKAYLWDDQPAGPDDREHLGFVELERAQSWESGEVPDSWVYLSFLKRKVHQFDYDLGRWTGKKEQAGEAVYLKFNRTMDNCFCAPVPAIARDGSLTKRSDGSPKNSFLALDFDHSKVRFGIEESVAFLREWLRDGGEHSASGD